MKFSTVLALGLAAIALANPIPDADAETSDVSERAYKRTVQSDIAAALPHPLEASDIMVSDVEPEDLVTRANANATAANSAKKAKGNGKGKATGTAKGKGKATGTAKGKATGTGTAKAKGKAKKVGGWLK